MSRTTDPTIELTSVPALGSYLHLKGTVKNATPAQVRVAVYIRVHGGWWNKPYWETPASVVQADGAFSVDITTGGRDEEASDITVFLVSEDYHPPGVRGETDLPTDVIEKALARADVTRT